MTRDETFITVLAGLEKKTFKVHLGKLCIKSTFFRVASSKKWLEVEEGVYRLPEISPRTFRTYKTWIDGGTILQIPRSTTKISERDQLIDLYVAADFLDDMHLRNKIVAALFDHMLRYDQVISPYAVRQIWGSTRVGAMIRRMIKDVMVGRLTHAYFENHVSQWPPELVQEVQEMPAAIMFGPKTEWERLQSSLPEYEEK